MWYSRKITRSWKQSKVDMTETPSNYMNTHTQLKGEDRGMYKLRARNDRLHAELCDFADRNNTKVSIAKSGNKIYYTVRGMGITICLINS